SQGGGSYEKQVLLQTTSTPRNAVLLKAIRDVRIFGRRQSPSSPSPSPRRKAFRPSPAGKKSAAVAAAAAAARASSSPRGKRTASPAAKAAAAAREMFRNGGGGGATRVTAGAQKYLLVGDTVDLGVTGAGRGFRCEYSYTLRLASSSSSATTTPPRSGTPEAAGARESKPSATREPSSGAGGGGGGGGGGTKRRLEDFFGDSTGAGAGTAARPPVPASPTPPPTPTPLPWNSGSPNRRKSPLSPKQTKMPLPASTDPPAAAGVVVEGSSGTPSKPPFSRRATTAEADISSGRGSTPSPLIKTHPAEAGKNPSAAEAAVEKENSDLFLSQEPLSPRRAASPRTPASRHSPAGKDEGALLEKRQSDASSVHEDMRVDDGCKAAAVAAAASPPAEQSNPTEARALTRMDDHVRLTLNTFVKCAPETTVAFVKEFLALGTAPPSSLCGTIVSSLLESRCRVRGECLRLQLRAMLDVDPNVWSPPDEDDAPRWLENLMGVILTDPPAVAKRRDPPSDQVLGAHAIVLELVVDYLAGGGGDSSSTAAAAERAMHFFALPATKGRGRRKPPPPQEVARNLAKHAVRKSAEWAVGAWGSEGAGSSSSSSSSSSSRRPRRRRPQESPELVRFRLLSAKLLAEVVESCGLPADEACDAIVDQMDLFAGGVPAASASASAAAAAAEADNVVPAAADAAAGAAAAVTERGLRDGARGGLVRALLGRPFCTELARALLRADLSSGSGRVGLSSGGGGGRLQAMLSRVVRRAEGGGGANELLLF
ncbi:unnamed protein product, partial [Ectocarpus sp. 8 AP-2014]